ncbi:putative membrane protein [Ochrobactrum sp. 19YEA23]|nr:putative membrane protein [Ochrobactrum sp. 19YEA23]
MIGTKSLREQKNLIESLEQKIARLLHYGTAVASFVIAIGLVTQWLSSLGMATAVLSGGNLIKAGVIVFILLPVFRVALMLIEFARARDVVYATISGVVLVIIGVGFAVGL